MPVSVKQADEMITALLARGYLVLGPVAGPASSVDNRVVFFDGATGKLLKDSGLTLSGNNTGDQTSIVGITGTLAQFNAALTGADFATGGGTATGTNTGDQTSIVGISGTKAQFDTACSDGNFLYVGDVTQYTDEDAQDAVGGMVDTTLVYVDGTPVLKRAPITGHVTIPDGSNTASLGSFTSAQLRSALTNPVGSGSAVFTGSPQFTGTIFCEQPVNVTYAAGATITEADMLGQLIRYTGAGAGALTTPTGTQLETAVAALTTVINGTAFDFTIFATGAGTATLTAGATVSILGSAAVLGGTSGLFRARRGAANTWVIYRRA